MEPASKTKPNMIDGFLTNRHEVSFCGSCGRKLQIGASTQGDFKYCNHGEIAQGTFYPDRGQLKANKEEKSVRFLIDKRNKEIQKAWKREQYSKTNQRIRI